MGKRSTEFKKGVMVDLKVERRTGKVTASISLLVGGLLIGSSMLAMSGCSNLAKDVSSAASAGKTISEVIAPIKDWQIKKLSVAIQQMQSSYGLSNGVTEAELKEVLDSAMQVKSRVEAEMSLINNDSYRSSVTGAVEGIEKVKYEGIHESYVPTRAGVYDLAALFGFEHKPNQEKAEAEARAKAEAEEKAKAEAEAQASNNKTSGSSSSKKSSSNKSSSSSSGNKSSGTKSSGSKTSGGSSSSSSGSKSSSGTGITPKKEESKTRDLDPNNPRDQVIIEYNKHMKGKKLGD